MSGHTGELHKFCSGVRWPRSLRDTPSKSARDVQRLSEQAVSRNARSQISKPAYIITKKSLDHFCGFSLALKKDTIRFSELYMLISRYILIETAITDAQSTMGLRYTVSPCVTHPGIDDTSFLCRSIMSSLCIWKSKGYPV